jgi:hypothetical protein
MYCLPSGKGKFGVEETYDGILRGTDLQIAAERALEGRNGAIAAMDPHTGRDPGDGVAAGV